MWIFNIKYTESDSWIPKDKNWVNSKEQDGILKTAKEYIYILLSDLNFSGTRIYLDFKRGKFQREFFDINIIFKREKSTYTH